MIIRRLLFFLLCFLYFYTSIAQKIELKGSVTEYSTGEPVAAALLRVLSTSFYALTDEDGNYAILFDKQGEYTISVTFVGFKEEIWTVDLQRNLIHNFVLKSDMSLDEVIVTTNAPDRRIKNLFMGVERLSSNEIKQMPSLMGEVDVLKVIQLLPGVQTTSEGSSGYSVRGGSPDQNSILLDNATVYNASHLLGFFSVFNNDVISEIDLYKGDLPLKYGGRLSSLLEVKTKERQPEKMNGVGGIGLITSRLTLDGPIGDKTSWLISGRRSYADLFLKLSSNKALNQTSIYFYDLNGKFTHRFSDLDVIDFSGYYGKDNFSANPGRFYYGNGTAAFNWRHIFSEYLSSKISLSLSNYDYGLESEIENAKAIWISSITDYMMRIDMKHVVNDLLNMIYGMTSTFHHFQPGYASFMGAVDFKVDPTNALEHGIYVSNAQKFSESLSVKYGTRFSLFQNIGQKTVFLFDEQFRLRESTTYNDKKINNTYSAWEPRIDLVYRVGETSSVKGNYVHNVQFIQLANNSASGSPLDIWFHASSNIKPQSIDMFSVGYFRNSNENMFESSVELYYKNQHNVIDFAEHAQLLLNKHLESEVRKGKGKAYGAEFMLRKSKGDLTGFANYTLSRSDRTIPGINGGKTFLSPYDRTHSLNILVNYALSKSIILSAIWVYATGNPTTYPSGRFEINNQYFPIYSGRNEYRRPDYHRLDLSFTYISRQKFKKLWQGEWNVSLYNAYGKKNPWIITYSQQEESGIPYAEMMYLFGIVPSISYNFKF